MAKMIDCAFEWNPTLNQMVKIFLSTYEQDEIRINGILLSLCEFIRVYFQKNKNGKLSIELIGVCVEQMQACEVDKFQNLNKLAILINLIGSLLNGFHSENDVETSHLFVQLMKILVQIINTFNIGRGGLSLSFMGNFITKSAHVSLLQLLKITLLASQNPSQKQKNEIVKAVLCLKDEKNNLLGSSWLIPLMLHRETQIRSISFSLISLLIDVSFARRKLFTNETGGIWSIALNVLLNRAECSIVRTQACAFLINLTNSIKASDLKSTNNGHVKTNQGIGGNTASSKPFFIQQQAQQKKKDIEV